MKRLFTLIFLLPALAFADAVIFSGNDVKTLKQNIDLFGVAKILSGSLNPSVAGVAAPQGSIYLSTVNGTYEKTGPLATDWKKMGLLPINLASDITGVLPIANGGTGLSTLGSANSVLGVNNSGTSLEYKGLSGTANQVNVTNGAGTITLSTPQDIATTSSPTFNSLTLTNPLNLTNGGTNKALTASAGSVVYSDADSFELSAVGTPNQVLISNGTAAPSWSSVSTLLDTTYFKQLGNSFGVDGSLGTNDAFGLILETNNTRRAYFDDATYSVFFGDNSLTTGSSPYPLWLDNGTGQDAFAKFTSGAATGTSSSDGFDVGYLGASGAHIWNNEASPLYFGTSNTQRMQISSGGLVAIGGSAPTASAKLDIQGTDGALLLPRLTTTQKNALTPAAGMIVWDTTLSQLQVYDGSTWRQVIIDPQNSNLTLAGSATLAISLTHTQQTWLVQGASAAITMSTTPFGSSAPVSGAEIVVIGNDDTNTVTFPANDAAKGIIGYSVTLGRGQVATFKYNATLDRYVIKSVSN